MIQILLHLVNTFCELLSGSVVDVRQKTVHKAVLKCAPLFDDSAGFVCAEQMGLPAVVCVRLTSQITFTDKLVYVDRYEVGFDLPRTSTISRAVVYSGCSPETSEYRMRSVGDSVRDTKVCIQHCRQPIASW